MPKNEHPYPLLLKECQDHGAELVVVSKTRSLAEIEQLYHMGQRVFGENRVQELLQKAPVMSPDIQWHLIGHLQTNKVKSVLPHVACIQSLDRENLWDKIQAEAEILQKNIPCLLQLKIAQEESKHGWSFEALEGLLKNGKHLSCPNVILSGVMGLASFSDDKELVRHEMRQLRIYFEELKLKYFHSDPGFQIISMGMSGDYKIALEEGSTMIRVGSLLF